MANATLARRYAQAIFSLAKDAGHVAEVGRDLQSVRDALADDATVERAFLSPVFQRAQKTRWLSETFDRKLDPIALHSLLLLVRKRREALLRPIVEEYAALALTEAGKSALRIESARPLAAGERDRIVARLGRVYDTSFDVSENTEPALLGGVRISIGDVLVDGSVAGRLEQLARELTKKPS